LTVLPASSISSTSGAGSFKKGGGCQVSTNFESGVCGGGAIFYWGGVGLRGVEVRRRVDACLTIAMERSEERWGGAIQEFSWGGGGGGGSFSKRCKIWVYLKMWGGGGVFI
jgi:hypothetical protein